MSVYRRKGSKFWYIRIGRAVDRSSRTTSRTEALALEARIRAELWRTEQMGEQPRRTFAEAAADWAEEVGRNRKGWDRDWYRLQRLVEAIGGTWTEDTTTTAVDQAIPESAQSPASRNHYRSLARTVLRYEARNGLLRVVPAIRMERVSNQRVRFLADWEEADRLIDGMPAHWKDPARFTLLTGVRQGTLRALRREWIHGDLLVIPGEHTKSGRQLAIPLDQTALRVACRQPLGPALFLRPDGTPLARMENKVWRKVLERSGVEDFRWHDLRHTWASWMMMTGEVSLYELQQLGDWSTPAMVQRYAHLHPGYLRDVVRRASAQLQRNDPDSAQTEPVQDRSSNRK